MPLLLPVYLRVPPTPLHPPHLTPTPPFGVIVLCTFIVLGVAATTTSASTPTPPGPPPSFPSKKPAKPRRRRPRPSAPRRPRPRLSRASPCCRRTAARTCCSRRPPSLPSSPWCVVCSSPLFTPLSRPYLTPYLGPYRPPGDALLALVRRLSRLRALRGPTSCVHHLHTRAPLSLALCSLPPCPPHCIVNDVCGAC